MSQRSIVQVKYYRFNPITWNARREVSDYSDVIVTAMVYHSNHRHFDCLLSRLFMCRSKIISKLRVTGSHTKGQQRGNCFHLTMSSCSLTTIQMLMDLEVTNESLIISESISGWFITFMLHSARADINLHPGLNFSGRRIRLGAATYQTMPSSFSNNNTKLYLTIYEVELVVLYRTQQFNDEYLTPDHKPFPNMQAADGENCDGAWPTRYVRPIAEKLHIWATRGGMYTGWTLEGAWHD